MGKIDDHTFFSVCSPSCIISFTVLPDVKDRAYKKQRVHGTAGSMQLYVLHLDLR